MADLARNDRHVHVEAPMDGQSGNPSQFDQIGRRGRNRGRFHGSMASSGRRNRRPHPSARAALTAFHDAWTSLFDGATLLLSRLLAVGHHRNFALVMIAVGVCAGPSQTWSQGVAAFAAETTPGDIARQIRSMTRPELDRIAKTRACNITIPLVGGGEIKDADVGTLRKSADMYATWERIYQSRRSANQPIVTDADATDKGRLKYLYHRSEGVSAKSIDLFTRTFLVRNLYRDGKHEDAVMEANKLIADYRLRPVRYQVDQLDKSTYLSDDALGNATLLYSTLSRLRLGATEAEQFNIITNYFDMRDDLLSVVNLFHATDSDEEILDRAGTLGVKAANGSLGDNARANIAAAWMSPDRTSEAFIVIKGNKPTTIKVEVDVEEGGNTPPPPPPPGRRLAAAGSGDDRRPGQPLNSGDSSDSDGSDGGFSKLTPNRIVGATILIGAEAQSAYRSFVERQLTRYSSKDMWLFDVQRDDHGALITLAQPDSVPPGKGSAGALVKIEPSVRTIRISDDDFKKLISATGSAGDDALRQLIPNSKSTALVAYSNPFVSRGSSYRDTTSAFTFQLQKAEPDIRVFSDPLSAMTAANVRGLSGRLVGKASDYIAYIDDGSFKVTDFNVVNDIRKLLTKAGVRIVSGVPLAGKPAPSAKNVIVISAHSDQQLEEYIAALGKAGAFKNNFIILNSCETAITQHIADRITKEFGARAAFLHQGFIPVANVQDLMVGLTKEIQKQPRASLVDTLRRVVRGVGLNGVWSVCETLVIGEGISRNG